MLVDTVATPCTPIDMVKVIRSLPDNLSLGSCLLLTTHWARETATGKRCFNWNVGNKKKVKGRPYMMLRRVWEILRSVPAGASTFAALSDGTFRVTFEPPHVQTHFMAFDSLGEGVSYYVESLRTKYPRCWPHVLASDPVGFAGALKSHHYYTAPLSAYAAQMKSRLAGLTKELVPALASEFLAISDVREYQRSRGLDADGIVGPLTRAAMFSDLEAAW